MPALRPTRVEGRGTYASCRTRRGCRGSARARPRCRFVLLRIHFIPGLLTYSVPLFLRRQCDRTPGSRIARTSKGARSRAGGCRMERLDGGDGVISRGFKMSRFV